MDSIKKSQKWKLKTQQRFKREKHDVVTEKINKIVLSLNDDKKCNQLTW